MTATVSISKLVSIQRHAGSIQRFREVTHGDLHALTSIFETERNFLTAAPTKAPSCAPCQHEAATGCDENPPGTDIKTTSLIHAGECWEQQQFHNGRFLQN